MKLTKYISRGTWLKLGIFLAVIGAAWIFDHFHEVSVSASVERSASHQDGSEKSYSCFYAAQASYSLKAPVQKTTLKKVFQEKFNRQAREHINARSLFASKAEIQQNPYSYRVIQQLIPFWNYSLGKPDDLPHRA